MMWEYGWKGTHAVRIRSSAERGSSCSRNPGCWLFWPRPRWWPTRRWGWTPAHHPRTQSTPPCRCKSAALLSNDNFTEYFLMNGYLIQPETYTYPGANRPAPNLYPPPSPTPYPREGAYMQQVQKTFPSLHLQNILTSAYPTWPEQLHLSFITAIFACIICHS